MSDQHKTKEELIIELEQLQQKYDSLKESKDNYITERERAEDQIKTILRTTIDGFYLVDIEGRILETNDSYCSMIGYSREELLQMKVKDIEAADTQEVIKKRIQKILETGYALFETKHLRKDGRVIDIEASVNYLVHEQPKLFCFMRDITERKQAENALQKSQSTLEIAQQIAQIGSWEYDIATDKPTWSKQMFVLFGRDPSLGEPSWQEHRAGIHPDDWEALDAAVTSATEYNIEFRLLHPTSGTRWAWTIGQPVIDKMGKVVKLKGTVQDITERKQAEEAFQNERLMLRTLIDNIPDSIYSKDLTSRKTLANRTELDYLGAKSEAEILGKDDFEFYPKELAEKFLADDQSVIQTGTPVLNREEYIVDSSGQKRWLLSSKIPLHNKDGRIIGLAGIGRDITERKCAEDALRESEERFRKIFDEGPMGIAIATMPDGRLLRVNGALCEMMGYTEEEFTQHTFLNVTHPDHRTVEMEAVKGLHAGNIQKHITEKRYLKKNGDVMWAVRALTKIISSDGKSSYALSMIEDITERKRVELELLKAKEHAEESDRLKSAFLANMSHEIRTPMNGILGFSELLKNPALSGDKQQKYIRIIEKSGVRMLNIINDIVDISKIEAGLMKHTFSESNINEQIEFIVTFFKPEVESKGIKLHYKNSLPVRESTIYTDREKVFAILTNLVKNAIKFTNAGSIEIGYTQKEDFLEFYVKDTGIGIPPDRQEAIFERFIQSDIADKQAYHGAGLGLSISKAYIEMLGGKIWVESREGIGSTFYFTLPRNRKPYEKKISTVIVPAYPETPVRNLKILIVENDWSSEMLLRVAIEKISDDILLAKTGVEAIEACRKNQDIDLILMDIQMPEMNGYDATREIRQFNKNVIIIGQTAYGIAGDREKSIEAGCDDYISKPISVENLKALIYKHMTIKV